MIEDNLAQLVAAGIRVELNETHETLAPALQSRMQLNILNMEGIRGGVETAKKPSVPAGETIKSVQKQIEATAGPKTIPIKRGRPTGKTDTKPRKERTDKGKKRSGSADAKPVAKGKGKGAGDDEFMAGIEEEAAKSDEEA
jgi:hypothetical protein